MSLIREEKRLPTPKVISNRVAISHVKVISPGRVTSPVKAVISPVKVVTSVRAATSPVKAVTSDRVAISPVKAATSPAIRSLKQQASNKKLMPKARQ